MTTGLTLENFSYFVIFCLTMTFSPGPMTIFLLSLGLKSGLRSAFPAQMGASLAYLISIIIFAVGLSEIIKDYPLLTHTIQLTGISYIIYLAYKQWTSKEIQINIHIDLKNFKDLFSKGMLTGMSNPKTILMFTAVFPQFSAQKEHQMIDISILGITFLILQFASGCSYCYFGQRIKPLLDQPSRQSLLHKTSAVLLLAVAVMLSRSFLA